MSETQHQDSQGAPGDTSVPAARKASAPDAESIENALIVARIADDFRGSNILLLDMRKITAIVDYFIIATVNSKRQMKAMAEETDIVMKKRGSPRLGAEGEGETVWMLRDYGDVVLHIFTHDGRELYTLEQLWADAPRLNWQE